MKILHIKGANTMMGLNQNEYLTVPLVSGSEYVTDAAGNQAQVPNMTAAFKPTPEELEKLNRGASIHLSILGQGWPPMKLLVQEPPADPANPDDIEFDDPKMGDGDPGMQNGLHPGQFIPQWRGGHVQIVDAVEPCELKQGDQVVRVFGQEVKDLDHFMLLMADATRNQEFVHMEVIRGYGGPMRGARIVPVVIPTRVDVPQS